MSAAQDQFLAVVLEVPNLDVGVVPAGDQPALNRRRLLRSARMRIRHQGDGAYTPGMAAERLVELAGLDVPQADRVVVAGGDQQLAVGGELQGVDGARVTLQRRVERALDAGTFCVRQRASTAARGHRSRRWRSIRRRAKTRRRRPGRNGREKSKRVKDLRNRRSDLRFGSSQTINEPSWQAVTMRLLVG